MRPGTSRCRLRRPGRACLRCRPAASGSSARPRPPRQDRRTPPAQARATPRLPQPTAARPRGEAIEPRPICHASGMTYINTIPESEATGAVAAMYEADRELGGFVRNFAKAFSPAPDIYAAWVQLNSAIKARMDLRRYELATIAA